MCVCLLVCVCGFFFFNGAVANWHPNDKGYIVINMRLPVPYTMGDKWVFFLAGLAYTNTPFKNLVSAVTQTRT